MERTFRYTAAGLILVLATVLSYGLGASRAGAVATAQEAGGGPFGLVEEAYRILKQDHVDRSTLDAGTLVPAAIRGMVEALGDPHTAYIDADTYKLERHAFEGAFQGIGATVAMVEGAITIVSPIRGSPAERAGIRPGDRILAVDGDPTDGMALADAVARIRGLRGSKVALTILHVGTTLPERIEIVRDEIRTPSVFAELRDDGIAHVRIGQFTNRTNEEIVEALRGLRQTGMQGLVLDLRRNPGGLLEETVRVTSQFLTSGAVLYEARADGPRKEWSVRPGGLATDIPLVILVDRGSASGSEVLAGALQDAGRAPLVGTRTFGKGTVNQVHEMSDQSALYVSIARWYTPKGRQIEGGGLQPDIEVALTDDDLSQGRDPQLERALDILLRRG